MKRKPPILSFEGMKVAIWNMGIISEVERWGITQRTRFEAIARAQRDIDMRFYEKSKRETSEAQPETGGD